jgi:hypothetical protein
MDDDVTNTILTSLLAFDQRTLNQPLSVFYGVALGLLFMQQNSNIETILETLGSMEFGSARVIESVVDIGA